MASADAAFEVGEQLAAVAQPGQAVRGGLCLELAPEARSEPPASAMISSAIASIAIGAGPMPERKLPVGDLALATTIQSLALPAVAAMWR